MPTNDFKALAIGGSANVQSQADYLLETSLRANGFSSGRAPSVKANKIFRQSTVIAEMIGSFINDASGLDALDDGDLATLLARFKLAVVGQMGGVRWRGMVAITSTGSFNPATYNLTTTDKILIILLGGGGGGASITGSVGGGGGAGELAMGIFTAPASSTTVTIGSGGAGNNVGSTASAGNTTSFGALMSALGGGGGSAGPGAGGTGGSGGQIRLPGGAGGDILSAAQDWAPGGAAALFSGPGLLNVGAGSNPRGSGGAATASTPEADAGTAGLCIVIY